MSGSHAQPASIAPAASGLTAFAAGEGQTVVLVHGALGDYRQWQPIADRLRLRCRVVALSRRHHWPNDPPAPGAGYSVESHRDDLLALLRSIGQPVHVVGHSYGAVVVLSAVLAAPTLMRSLVLIEPPLPGLLSSPVAGLDAENASRAAMVATLQARVAAGDNDAASVTLFDWAQGGPGGFAALPDACRRQLLANANTIGPTYATPPPHIDCAQLASLKIPTLVLNGAGTRLFYQLSGQTAAACIPGAKSANIPEARHMVIVERPGATAVSMLEFLAEQTDASQAGHSG